MRRACHQQLDSSAPRPNGQCHHSRCGKQTGMLRQRRRMSSILERNEVPVALPLSLASLFFWEYSIMCHSILKQKREEADSIQGLASSVKCTNTSFFLSKLEREANSGALGFARGSVPVLEAPFVAFATELDSADTTEMIIDEIVQHLLAVLAELSIGHLV